MPSRACHLTGSRHGVERAGELLWQAPLPAGGYATPATYEVGGRQYVVIAAGGGKMGTRSGDASWIFDRQRADRFPVDGGVFDIPASAEAEIPIRAKLPVAEPTFFAITVEHPGGVVVSSRERIVLFATV